MENDWNSIPAQLNGSFLEQQIRRTNRNLLLFNLAIILCVATYGWAQRRYYYNFFTGPFQTNAESLAAIKNPDEPLRYFIKLQGGTLAETGVQEIETRTRNGVQNRSVAADYSILVVGKRLLIVKKNPGDTSTTLQGAYGEIPPEVHAAIIDPLLEQYPHADLTFLPGMLDATSFRYLGYFGLAIWIPLALLAIWNLTKLMRRRSAPEKHPILREAARYGSLVNTSQQFDSELKGNTVKFGKATFTKSWVLMPSKFGLEICYIPELVWAYKKVTTHKRNSQVTAKTYTVMMYDRYARYGVPFQLQVEQKKMDEVLTLLVQRTPSAIFGYSDDLEKSCKKNWPGIVAAVEAKRAGVARAS
jgi:hypothetical protein